MILILRPALKVSLFCINLSMYWLNRIRLMMLRFDIHFNDKITHEEGRVLIDQTSLLLSVLKPMFRQISAESNNTLGGIEAWLIKTCSSLVWFCYWNGYQNVVSLAWFCSTNTWSDRYKRGWLQAQDVISTTSFQVNNKVIFIGISVFTLVKQGY